MLKHLSNDELREIAERIEAKVVPIEARMLDAIIAAAGVAKAKRLRVDAADPGLFEVKVDGELPQEWLSRRSDGSSFHIRELIAEGVEWLYQEAVALRSQAQEIEAELESREA